MEMMVLVLLLVFPVLPSSSLTTTGPSKQALGRSGTRNPLLSLWGMAETVPQQ